MEGPSSNRPRAVFMAFGTKGDVHPIAALAAAFACDQLQYTVFLITHSAHENLSQHLAAKNVLFLPVSTPPVVSARQDHDTSTGAMGFSLLKKKEITTKEHRKECLSVMERIFGAGSSLEDDLVVINFFALEGWSLAELFQVRCAVAAPYVVPYSAPSSFERQFKKDVPLLYKYLMRAPTHKVSWNDVTHWMWPLFTEDWGSWRSELNLSPCPLTDPVTGLPTSHDRDQSPLLLYGFRKEVVECPAHVDLQQFLISSTSDIPIFIGFSSIGSMGFLTNSRAFLRVLKALMKITSYRFILFSAGYEPLESAIHELAKESSDRKICCKDGVLLWNRTIPYSSLFRRCAAAVHHGGSGSTAAALHTGIPQVICPFLLDQFYWAERMFWLGVAPKPLDKNVLFPDGDDITGISNAANALSNAISSALTPQIKACATQIAERISLEDGVGEAVKALKEEIN